MSTFTIRLRCALALVLTLCLCGAGGAASAKGLVKLPSFQADETQTSVSGLSSGAFMAGQFQVAFSSTVVGAGIIAGGPFYCSGTWPYTPFVMNAMTICMSPDFGMAPSPSSSLQSAKIFAKLGLIDDPVNLKRQRVYVFSGTDDTTVVQAVVDQTAAFYKLAGLPAKNIEYVRNVPAGHAIITSNNADTKCALTASPYINDCDFMQSQQLLTFIYGKLNPPATQLSGTIIPFDQDEFISSNISSMASTGYLYVPQSCQTQTCKVHVVFHGCEQGATGPVGDRFYSTTGYNEIADTNNLIVLYPQVKTSQLTPFNPKGCWDFWGYSSANPAAPDFYSHNAPQMAAVKAMLDRLARPRQAVATASAP